MIKNAESFMVTRGSAARRTHCLKTITAGIALILSGLADAADAQARQVDVFGYFEPQIIGFTLNGETPQLSSNKLRVDLDAAFSERVTFTANFDYITYHGATTFYLFDFLVDAVTAPLPPQARDQYTFEFRNRNFLDNAYLRLSFDRFDLTVGKQQISPGAGYAWNPTDVFNVKDILDPTYEKPGHNAVRLDVPFGEGKQLSVIYSPEQDFGQSGKIIQFKARAGHFDISFTGGERYWTLTDYETFAMVQDRRHIAGGDIVGELLGIGVWTEAAYNDMVNSEDYFEGLIGFDYTFDNGLYILNELYRNEQGESDYRRFDLSDWVRYFSSETKVVCRDQWYAYISYPATDLLTIGGSIITSLNDGSAVLVPAMMYNFDNNMDITFFGNLYAGKEGKTFSPKLGSGALLRARYYF